MLEALAGALRAGGGEAGRTVLGAVILNAAMLPGWPYPRAFEGAAGQQATAPRLIADAARALDMSPQEVADYLASIGANAALLDRLRKLFDRIEKREAKALLGFLTALVSALREIEGALTGNRIGTDPVPVGAEPLGATGRHAFRI